MTEVNQVREQFEAAYLAEMKRLHGITGTAESNLAWRREDGSYVDPMLRLALWAWETSRHSLVVELPSPEAAKRHATSYEEGFADGEERATERAKKAIEVLGLKVAP
ncbi:hypothetical protein [Pseudomonas guariconensis]|uniref:hypothetical protein n=1 Tax=Pseudomonas guariconensis TaxID=1288410 RepID=UPI0039066C3F